MLQFRNLTVTPDSPVAKWGVEGIVAAVDHFIKILFHLCSFFLL